MASKKDKWSKAKYRAIVAGETGMPYSSLRTYLRGFEARDGFDLRRYEEWTPAQRRKIRDAFTRVRRLTSQDTRWRSDIPRSRLPDVHAFYHGNIKSKDFKGAFVPSSMPIVEGEKAKDYKPPKLFLSPDAEVIYSEERGIKRADTMFDQKALATDTRREVERALDRLPKDSHVYYVKVDEKRTLSGETRENIVQQIIKWINQYDGVKDLPRSSGNYGDNPKHHHWTRWLNGVVGMKFAGMLQGKRAARARLQRGLNEARARREEFKNFMRRRTVKPRAFKKPRKFRF